MDNLKTDNARRYATIPTFQFGTPPHYAVGY